MEPVEFAMSGLGKTAQARRRQSPSQAVISSVPVCMSILLLIMLAAGLAGCATASRAVPMQSVRVCAAGECSEVGQRCSVEQILQALDQLFQANDGAEITLCSSDPETHVCTGDDIGYLVLGGFVIPGRGAAKSGKLSQFELDAETQSIRYVMSLDLRFLGIPLLCSDHNGRLTANSERGIAMTGESYLCNWMAVGIMTASFSFEIDLIDFDKGQLGGYWRHSVTGTGNGRGEGYALIELPKQMPFGVNWLVQVAH